MRVGPEPGSCAITPNRKSAETCTGPILVFSHDLAQRCTEDFRMQYLRTESRLDKSIDMALICHGLTIMPPHLRCQLSTKAPTSDHNGHGTDGEYYTSLHQSARHVREEHVRGISLRDCNLGQSTAQLHAAQSRHQTP